MILNLNTKKHVPPKMCFSVNYSFCQFLEHKANLDLTNATNFRRLGNLESWFLQILNYGD